MVFAVQGCFLSSRWVWKLRVGVEVEGRVGKSGLKVQVWISS